jgi:predicted amidohydrolase
MKKEYGLNFTGAYLKRVVQKAHQLKSYLAAAFCAEKNRQNFNFGVIISSEGTVCGYQPMICMNGNKKIESGTFLKPIQTKIGKIGLVIEEDQKCPQINRSLKKLGAETIISLKLGEIIKLKPNQKGVKYE